MIGLVYILLPFMVLPLYSSIEKLDNAYLEAARDLGANKWQSFIRIVIPLTMPGIIAGCLLVLLPAMELFFVADLMGGQMTRRSTLMKRPFRKGNGKTTLAAPARYTKTIFNS